MLEAIARALFGIVLRGAGSKGAASSTRTTSAGLGWKGWAIAGAVVLVLILAAFAVGAWWQSERCGQTTRAAAERSAAVAARDAEAVRARDAAAAELAREHEGAAAAGEARAQQERQAIAAEISGEVERVLDAGERCPIGAEFGGLWNRAIRAPGDD